ncbi:MAG: hypothetical protein JSV43_06130 [Methanobacteriota archaeon]|nr:MAG: hypothetical protein JSV43_06130 [Euryarchaeota archaeon]
MILAVLTVAVILLLAQLVISSLIYLAIQDMEPAGDGAEEITKGSFTDVDVMGSTTTDVTLGPITGNPAPTKLKIILKAPTESGTYTFPSDSDGVILVLTEGVDTGTITYRDYADNERVNAGDQLVLSDLVPETVYIIILIWAPNDNEMDAKSFTTASIGLSTGQFISSQALNYTSAEAIFGWFSEDVNPTDLQIVLYCGVQSGIYSFPGNSHGTILTLVSGSDIAIITYLDSMDDGDIDVGDSLLLTGLSHGSQYVIFLVWATTEALIDYEVFYTPLLSPPMGQFASASATSNTTATAEFAGFSTNPEPVNLIIVLERVPDAGSYSFPNNQDGVVLTLQAGTMLGTITYRDYADNELVNGGDQLLLSGLTPSSSYTIRLIWAPTGDTLDVESFNTPA